MRSISEALAQDHRRLEHALEASLKQVSAAQWDAAAATFGAFRQGMERHMQIEEQILFPAVEAGTETPLTAILRKGHRDLCVFFDELDDAIAARDAEECGRNVNSIRSLLARHDEKEEAELYPAAQALLGAEAQAVAARLDG